MRQVGALRGGVTLCNDKKASPFMPLALPKKLRGIDKLFVGVVLLPTLLSVFYFGFLASDVYLSESKFVVRSPQKPSANGLGVILKTAGFSNAGEEVYAAKDYVMSRDALRELNRQGAFEKAYSDPSISVFNRFNALGFYDAFEDLYEYYQRKVTVEYDATSTITKLTVRAYSPQDAQRFNQKLLEMAEETVNRLNARGRQDLIRFAQAEVDLAERDAYAAASALSEFRNRKGILDPERQGQVNLQMISKLQDELIGAKAQLAQLQALTPQNPRVSVQRTLIDSLEGEIANQTRMVAGDSASLATNAGGYQRLQLEVQFADKQLTSALASLEEAQNEARRKQAYVERIVQPNLSDSPLEPRRFRGMIATFLTALVAWGIIRMLLAGVREHVG